MYYGPCALLSHQLESSTVAIGVRDADADVELEFVEVSMAMGVPPIAGWFFFGKIRN